MLEPDNQKVYLTTDDLSEVFPDAEDTEMAAWDVIENENSFIMVDGEQLAIGYDEDKDAVFIMVSNEGDETLEKARKFMDMFVKNELYTAREIEGQNGAVPDENYPWSVNVAGKGSEGATSYYPSYEQFGNAMVVVSSGTAWPYTFYVNVPDGDKDPEAAIEAAVVQAEATNPGALHDVTEVEKEMADDGHYDPSTGEKDAIFEDMYFYVDATASGAKSPYYLLNDGVLGVLPHKGALA